MTSNCLSFNPTNMLAVGISTRVDLYQLYQPETQDDVEFEPLKPSAQLFKFKDVVTACEFRPDGQLILAGDIEGRVQLMELKNKYILRSYECKNRINALSFA